MSSSLLPVVENPDLNLTTGTFSDRDHQILTLVDVIMFRKIITGTTLQYSVWRLTFIQVTDEATNRTKYLGLVLMVPTKL